MKRPLIIAIGGLSASGKTTLAQDVAEALDAPLLQMDDYYRDIAEGFSPQQVAEFNWDRLEMFCLDEWTDHLWQLSHGKAVDVPIYDFTVSRRTGSRRVSGSNAVVVEGQFVLCHAPALDAATLRVYVDLDPNDALQRRTLRDAVLRGRSPESVHKQWREHVEPAYRNHVFPSRESADLHLNGDGNRLENMREVLRACEHLEARLTYLA
jgi:uridine kinase